MLPSTQIPVGIYLPNCLSWSMDGELAIAAGEEVYLLLPCHAGPEAWIHVHFRVNTFASDEWPVRPPASFANMSIGEEQGKVTVASLQWSPAGLAKYRRSLLAVLTTNLMLSLWAPGPDPRDPEGWKRVWIVNDVVIPPGIALGSTVGSLRKVRSMAWVPPNPQHADTESPISTRKWGIPLLAVADDDNGLCVLNVYGPFTSGLSQWGAQVLAYKVIMPVLQRSFRPSLLNEALNARQFIDKISLAQWCSFSELSVDCLTSGTSQQVRLNVILEPSVSATVTDLLVNQIRSDERHAWPLQVPEFMQAPIKQRKARYSNEINLSVDDVLSRTWGVAYSEHLCAVCITCHPAKMIEYQAPAAESATIIFSHVGDASNGPSVFPWQSRPRVDHDNTRQNIVSTILGFLKYSQVIGQPLKLTRFDLKLIYVAIIAEIMLHLHAIHQRPTLDDVELALTILEDRSGIQLQPERKLLKSFEQSSEDRRRLLDELIEERSLNRFGTMAPGVQLLDNCLFCGDTNLGLSRGLEGFMEAYCANNHPFARCALTFLPILEPGCSKYCSKCKAEFINEDLHPEISPFEGGQVTASEQNKPSLANLLFAKFDICPYCEGKFCE